MHIYIYIYLYMYTNTHTHTLFLDSRAPYPTHTHTHTQPPTGIRDEANYLPSILTCKIFSISSTLSPTHTRTTTPCFFLFYTYTHMYTHGQLPESEARRVFALDGLVKVYRTNPRI